MVVDVCGACSGAGDDRGTWHSIHGVVMGLGNGIGKDVVDGRGLDATLEPHVDAMGHPPTHKSTASRGRVGSSLDPSMSIAPYTCISSI